MTASEHVKKLLDSMTMEEKVGQMLVYGFSGTYPHPDILEVIEKYHIAGFRVTPRGRKFIRYLKEDSPGAARVTRAPEPKERVYGAEIGPPAVPATEYARVLNTLRKRSLETGAGIPIYFALDFEGNQSADYYAPGIVGFPHPMGLTASGDPSLCRRVARVIGRQINAVGINWIHSPALDVNTNPANPEIGTRSYSALPDVVAEYALQSLQGFTEANIVTTGKHFPGRGHSSEDVHFGMATISESKERMRRVHLAPFKTLIDAGLPAIILAHSIYPALDPEEEIVTVSKAVITDVLRGELNFKGVVVTDSLTMGGLVARYEVAEAAIRSIQAGVDLILLKDENALRGEVYHGLLDAVQKGRLSEDRVEEAVSHVLMVKERYGLLDSSHGIVDLDQVDKVLHDPEHTEVAAEAAARSVVVLRSQEGMFPIKPRTRVLVAEQVSWIMYYLNNHVAHPGALYEALLEQGIDAVYTDFDADDTFEQTWPIIQRQAAQVDLIVHTGFYERGSKVDKKIHERFLSLGKPTIFVANAPYGYLVSSKMPTVLVTFSAFAVSMKAVADILTGRTEPVAKLGFDPEKSY